MWVASISFAIIVCSGVTVAFAVSRGPGPRPPTLLGERADSERAHQAMRTAHSLTRFAETLYYQMLELQEIANTDACELEQPFDAGTGHRCVKYALLPWTVLQTVLSLETAVREQPATSLSHAASSSVTL
jgi:hypothetical protein